MKYVCLCTLNSKYCSYAFQQDNLILKLIKSIADHPIQAT